MIQAVLRVSPYNEKTEKSVADLCLQHGIDMGAKIVQNGNYGTRYIDITLYAYHQIILSNLITSLSQDGELTTCKFILYNEVENDNFDQTTQ